MKPSPLTMPPVRLLSRRRPYDRVCETEALRAYRETQNGHIGSPWMGSFCCGRTWQSMVRNRCWGSCHQGQSRCSIADVVVDLRKHSRASPKDMGFGLG